MTEPDRIWINDKWEAYLRPTFDGDTSGYIRVDLVDPAVTVGVKPPFYFDRYINGVRMAEDVCVERETTLESAMLVAARIASKGPNGEAPVLVYRAPVTQPMPDLSDRIAALTEQLAAAQQDAEEAEAYAEELEKELDAIDAKLAQAVEALEKAATEMDDYVGRGYGDCFRETIAEIKGESHD